MKPARHAMDKALNEHRTPCGTDGDRWISEDRTTREAVAPLCNTCPLLDPCRALAVEERPTWGVYAGTDYTKDPKPRKAAA
ncbi:WhiB family transcriptional regulator [Knoellia sp. CPCC 206435]|uniref:WhiB family transcriptional regulator n=1 Tax=Knoellia terrae TaxID=3404797 RepID=UPI003B428D9D